MSHVYRVIEVVGSSTTGVDDAIAKAVARAAETTRHLEWFETVITDRDGDVVATVRREVYIREKKRVTASRG